MSAPDEQDLLLMARAFVQLFLEVEAGRRSRELVEPLMIPPLAARVSPWWVSGSPPRRAGTARGTLIDPETFEAAVVAQGDRRSGVIAVRLERRGSNWRITQLARPECIFNPNDHLPDRPPVLVGLTP